jgi:hypothetical protein
MERRSAHIRQVPGICVSYYYFGSGTFPEKSGEHISHTESDTGKGRFLGDTEATLRRIGDIAVPHTMHELVRRTTSFVQATGRSSITRSTNANRSTDFQSTMLCNGLDHDSDLSRKHGLDALLSLAMCVRAHLKCKS